MSDSLERLLQRVPEGVSHARYAGRRWIVTKVPSARGRAVRLYAEELGGPDFVSANAYLIDGAWTLKPCEMPEERVMAFLASARSTFG
ncbi:MAG: peptide methionine sulfoxide reductase [Planctomycetota bacterium]